MLTGLGRVEDPNLSDDIRAFNKAGYAVVLVDARGSGASYGSRSAEWSPDEVEDLGEVVDWIVSRSWSNGSVGAYGVSYEGNTAELTAATDLNAVKAVAPLYADFDPFRDVAMPGGILNEGFIRSWSAANDATDRNDLCAATGVSD